MSSKRLTVTAPTSDKPTPLVQTRVTERLADFPWWALIIALMAIFLVYSFVTDSTYQDIIGYLIAGIRLTIIVTLVSFAFSLIIGLITAFAMMSEGTNIFSIVARNFAALYVQIIRGIPVIVLIFYTALVIVPASISVFNSLGDWMASMGWLAPDNTLSNLTSRGVSFVIRGIVALAINYGAFSAEVFRAGIQSIEKGQLEASRALGLNWTQMMRYVILPQAIRRIMPPLGNDFISMLKESSLVSVLGVGEITQLGKKYSAASFLYPQTYNTVAFLYLSMTLILSMGVKYMERRMRTGEET
ncbi:MAG: amino acid ABC transporter permease [Chloroflexota bacterium]|nr:MAG: amino acid ABC transporter permease [Chloroflexota bacterium]